MRTKAVYVVVSGETDVYFEQAWVSAWSLKHYNPGMEVECVVDPDTYDQVMGCYRRQALSVIDRLVRVEVPAQLGKKERSRWLKTSLRRHVEGDFLFIDTDTIVCDSLRDLDSLAGDVMMVRDHHCPFSEMTDAKYILQGIENTLGSRFTEDDYYNSGVIYTKDTPASHAFFEAWHAQWKEFHKQGVHTDQCSLAVLNMPSRTWTTSTTARYACRCVSFTVPKSSISSITNALKTACIRSTPARSISR